MTTYDVPRWDTDDELTPRWDDVLDGRLLPETEDELRAGSVVSALQAPGTPDELRGADGAITALLAVVRAAQSQDAGGSTPGGSVVSLAATGHRHRRVAVVTGSVVAVSVILGGTAAAAATGSLPAPFQRIAARYAGAPAVHDDRVVAPSAAPSPAASTDLTGTADPADAPHSTAPTQAAVHIASTAPAARTAVAGVPGSRPVPPGQLGKPVPHPGRFHQPVTKPGHSGVAPKLVKGRSSTAPGQSHHAVKASTHGQ